MTECSGELKRFAVFLLKCINIYDSLDISSFCLLFYTITYNLIKEDFTFKAIHSPLGGINATFLNSVNNNCDYRINKNNCDNIFFYY